MAVAEAFALQASGQLGNALALVDDDVEDVIPPPECSLPQLAAMFERRSADCKKLAGPQPDSDNGFDLASRQFFGVAQILRLAARNIEFAQAGKPAPMDCPEPLEWPPGLNPAAV